MAQQHTTAQTVGPHSFQLVSDLHLEFVNGLRFSDYVVPSAPNLVVCGDLGNPFKTNMKDFFRHASENFDKVFYVPGNHEYYSLEWVGKNQKMDAGPPKDHAEFDDEMESLVSEFPNIHLLNNQTYDFDPTTRLIGSTMWSPIEPSSECLVTSRIACYRYIWEKRDGKITTIVPSTVNAWFKTNRGFLLEQLKKCKNEGKKAIVLTHHMPSEECVEKRFLRPEFKQLNCAFFAPMEDVLREYADTISVWMFGHTHCSIDHRHFFGCRCVCNPAGYNHERNLRYKKDFVIKNLSLSL